MFILFGTIVEGIHEEIPILGIVPVAGISTVQLHEDTTVCKRKGSPVSWQAIRPGMRVEVSGPDAGGSHLGAKQVIVLDDAART